MAVILTDFRIFRKIITQIGDIFFSQKIVATLYQSKPVISSTPSLNVDQNCRFFIQPVGRASFLSCKTMMRLFPRAGWNWRLQRGLQVNLLGGANFQMETEIEFNSSKKIPNPNETFMRADPVLMEVGGSSTDHPHGQKRKLLEWEEGGW